MTTTPSLAYTIGQFVKGLCDRSMAAAALLLLLPLMGVIALAIYLQMGGPVLFTQDRPGYQTKVFRFYKFRTMNNDRDAEGNLLPDADRITGFGQFLRQTSLDELPQLINVLKGDISFVGPRPLLIRYLDRYTDEQKRRHNVPPGITGWAQVNGRNAIPWDLKFQLDVWYVDHWSLWLDFKILLLTVLKVVRREGISEANQATMSEFLGTLVTQEETKESLRSTQ
jgi:lipopolysaccharide/colanic/teichoic acid biosynthesis glycosyltransferase